MKIGGHTKRVTLAVVHNLGSDVRLGHEYLDSKVIIVSPETRSVTLKSGEDVPIIRRKANGTSRFDITEPKMNKRGIRNFNASRIYESITRSPHSEPYVRAQISAFGLRAIETSYTVPKAFAQPMETYKSKFKNHSSSM